MNAELNNLNLIRIFAQRRSRDLRVVLWTFGYDPAVGFRPRSSLRDRVRLLMYERADAVLFYWERGRDVVAAQSNLPRRKLFVAPNTLDTQELTAVKRTLDAKGRSAVRRELGISGKAHFVYVGRLVADKEVDRLLLAWPRVRAVLGDAELSIVGDGPELETLKALHDERGLSGVTFRGAIVQPEQIGRILYSSDAAVIPGRLGLAVVHAFCFGTPIISQQKGEWFHGEGVGYLDEARNCLLVPDGDTDALGDAMIRVGTDAGLQERLRDGSWTTLTERATVERMASGFVDATEYVRTLDGRA